MPILYPRLSRQILDAYFNTLRRCPLPRQAQPHAELVSLLSNELERLGLSLERAVPVSYQGVFGLEGEAKLDLVVEKTVIVQVLCLPVIRPAEQRLLAAQLMAGNYPLGVSLNFGGPEAAFLWQRCPK